VLDAKGIRNPCDPGSEGCGVEGANMGVAVRRHPVCREPVLVNGGVHVSTPGHTAWGVGPVCVGEVGADRYGVVVEVHHCCLQLGCSAGKDVRGFPPFSFLFVPVEDGVDQCNVQYVMG
jgi:hypothetical protein